MDKSNGAPQDLAKTILELGKFLELADHQPGRVKLTVSLLNLPRVYTVLGGATDAGDRLPGIPGYLGHETSVGFRGASVVISYNPKLLPPSLWDDLVKIKEKPEMEATVFRKLVELFDTNAPRNT